MALLLLEQEAQGFIPITVNRVWGLASMAEVDNAKRTPNTNAQAALSDNSKGGDVLSHCVIETRLLSQHRKIQEGFNASQRRSYDTRTA